MFLRGKHWLALACATSWAGCSAFGTSTGDNASPSNHSDAGADGLAPVTGTALGNYDLTVDIATVRHGTPAIAKVAVTRKPPFDRIIRVDLKDPPAGVTAELLELAPDATSGELKIVADGTVPQGPLTLTVRANVPQTTLDDLVIPKDVAVQGAPGELDTSFGDHGVFAVPNMAHIGAWDIQLGPSGSFFESCILNRGQRLLGLYNGDPVGPTTSFADAGTVPVSLGFPMLGRIEQAVDRLLIVGNTSTSPTFPNVQQTAQLRRLLFDGSIDPQFSFDDRYMIAYSAALRADGKIALLGRANRDAPSQGWAIDWLDGGGKPDTTVSASAKSNGASPSSFDFGVYGLDALYAISGNTAFRLTTAGGVIDAAFGTGGQLSLPASTVLYDAALDGKSRVVVTGLDTANGLYLARIADGRLDATWNGTGYASFGSGFVSSKFRTLKDGRTVQVGTLATGAATRCVVLARLDNGDLDPAFGTNGAATLAVDGCAADDLAVTPDGKLLIPGPKTVRVWL